MLATNVDKYIFRWQFSQADIISSVEEFYRGKPEADDMKLYYLQILNGMSTHPLIGRLRSFQPPLPPPVPVYGSSLGPRRIMPRNARSQKRSVVRSSPIRDCSPTPSVKRRIASSPPPVPTEFYWTFDEGLKAPSNSQASDHTFPEPSPSSGSTRSSASFRSNAGPSTPTRLSEQRRSGTYPSSSSLDSEDIVAADLGMTSSMIHRGTKAIQAAKRAQATSSGQDSQGFDYRSEIRSNLDEIQKRMHTMHKRVDAIPKRHVTARKHTVTAIMASQYGDDKPQARKFRDPHRPTN